MAGSGRIRLPMAIDAKAREAFTLFVICRRSARCPRCPLRQGDQATDACDVSSPRPVECPWSATRRIPCPSGMMPGSSK
jgi:hypothetical protein